MMSNYGRLARMPVKAQHHLSGVRRFAQVSNAKVEPFLLEDMSEYKTGNEEALPPFVISRQRGFLPRKDPLVHLPDTFSTLDSLLKRMTIHQPADKNGVRAPGLLAKGDFGQAVQDELKADGIEMKTVEQVIASGNTQLISALFRDYCFMTSAYLLEPVDRSFRKTGFYDKGRDVLPRQLAVPLKRLADALGHYPYMEYASSYALSNYQVKDPNHQGLAGKYSFDNMELIRSFEDASGSERGFILVHVEMVSYSGKLVDNVEKALAAANCGDIRGFEAAFEALLLTYRKINQSMDTMWSRSLPKDYLNCKSKRAGRRLQLAHFLIVFAQIDPSSSEQALQR
jgi:indoleamine 2,3-dioxygenase